MTARVPENAESSCRIPHLDRFIRDGFTFARRTGYQWDLNHGHIYKYTRYTYPQRVPRADYTRACTPSRVARLERRPVQDSIPPRAQRARRCMRSRFGFQPHANERPEPPGTRIAMRMRISVTVYIHIYIRPSPQS